MQLTHTFAYMAIIGAATAAFDFSGYPPAGTIASSFFKPQWLDQYRSSIPNLPVATMNTSIANPDDQIPACPLSAYDKTACRKSCNYAGTPYEADSYCNSDDIFTCPNVPQGGQKLWTPTFDDGPTDSTPIVLDVLKAKNLKTMFFIMGQNAMQNPDMLKRIVDEGHQIGIHTWSHPWLTTLSNDAIAAELMYTLKIVNQVTGKLPRFVRAPHGDVDSRVRAIFKAFNLTHVTWAVDSGDSGSFTQTSQIQSYTAAQVSAINSEGLTNIISLEHDAFPVAANAANAFLTDAVSKYGFTLQPISTCLNTNNFDLAVNPFNASSTTTTTTTTTVPGSSSTKAVATSTPFVSKKVNSSSTIQIGVSMVLAIASISSFLLL